MAVLVGGRMEAVVRPRSLFGPDYLLLAVLAVVSAAIHLWLISNAALTARDSVGFARYALGIQSPDSAGEPDPTRSWTDVIKINQQPPGYPVAIFIAAKFVRGTVKLLHPGEPVLVADTTLLAAQLVSGIAALLLVVPMYLIGRMLLGRSAGFAAALLFQVLPVPARITSDGLSEGLYLFAVALSIMFAVRAVRRPGVGGFLLCGLAVGVGYLIRPEALLVGGAAALVSGWLAWSRRWPRDLAAGRLTALAVGVALVAGPYMIAIGKLSNKPTANQIMEPGETPREKLLKTQPEGRAAPAVGGPLFAKWMNPPIEGIPRRTIWGAEAVVEETGKSLHYLPAAFALIGFIGLRRRMVAEPGFWVLLVLGAMNAALLVYLAARIGYISERHTLLLAMLGCLFAAAALEPIAAGLGALPRVGWFWAGKFGPPALLAILVGLALPATLKTLHANREGHKHAGRWLKEHIRDKAVDCLIDPFEWAGCYAERTLHHVFPDPPDAEVTYVVVDDKDREDDHSRLPRMAAARAVLSDGRTELVYHWPENVPADQAKVKVYRLVRPEGK